MIRDMETLSVEDERHQAARPGRAKRLSGFFPELRGNRKQAESKPRFRIESVAPAVERGPQRSPMRVLLRNAKTMKYLGSAERWTNDPKQARDFHNGWWATVYAFSLKPRCLVIYYEFDDERYNLRIPVLGHSDT
jgi:hypothetical protein